MYDRTGKELRLTYVIKNAFPVHTEFSDLDSQSSDVWMRRVEFANEGQYYEIHDTAGGTIV